MYIRKFRDLDAVELSRMHRETIRTINSKDYPKEQIKIWAERSTAKRFRKYAKDNAIFVALIKNKIIGFTEYKDNEVKALYVHKDYIGKGIDEKLLKKLIDITYKKGIRKLKCMSTITAKNFYLNQGFKVIRKTKFLIGNQKLKVYEMIKQLKY